MKKLIALLLCLVMVVSLFAACGAPEEGDGGYSITNRFESVWYDHDSEIFVDTETGVMYFYYDGYNVGGLTVMVDAEGNPLIWDAYK